MTKKTKATIAGIGAAGAIAGLVLPENPLPSYHGISEYTITNVVIQDGSVLLDGLNVGIPRDAMINYPWVSNRISTNWTAYQSAISNAVLSPRINAP